MTKIEINKRDFEDTFELDGNSVGLMANIIGQQARQSSDNYLHLIFEGFRYIPNFHSIADLKFPYVYFDIKGDDVLMSLTYSGVDQTVLTRGVNLQNCCGHQGRVLVDGSAEVLGVQNTLIVTGEMGPQTYNRDAKKIVPAYSGVFHHLGLPTFAELRERGLGDGEEYFFRPNPIPAGVDVKGTVWEVYQMLDRGENPQTLVDALFAQFPKP